MVKVPSILCAKFLAYVQCTLELCKIKSVLSAHYLVQSGRHCIACQFLYVVYQCTSINFKIITILHLFYCLGYICYNRVTVFCK